MLPAQWGVVWTWGSHSSCTAHHHLSSPGQGTAWENQQLNNNYPCYPSPGFRSWSMVATTRCLLWLQQELQRDGAEEILRLLLHELDEVVVSLIRVTWLVVFVGWYLVTRRVVLLHWERWQGQLGAMNTALEGRRITSWSGNPCMIPIRKELITCISKPLHHLLHWFPKW